MKEQEEEKQRERAAGKKKDERKLDDIGLPVVDKIMEFDILKYRAL